MSGYCYCGLTFMALLSPFLGLTIDYCSLQARGHRVRMSGWEWLGWRLELPGGDETASMHEADKRGSMM